jgi:hypothetical protein
MDIRGLLVLVIVFSSLGCETAPSSNDLEKIQRVDSLPQTDLRFLTKRVVFKAVPPDTLLIAKYSFINIGQKDLVIQEIDPDCTCTGYSLDKKEVHPGDTGHIILRYPTKDKVGEAKTYAIVTANTATKLYSLEIVASIKN